MVQWFKLKEINMIDGYGLGKEGWDGATQEGYGLG